MKGVGQGWCGSILSYNDDRPRLKIISPNSKLFSYFSSLYLFPPKQWYCIASTLTSGHATSTQYHLPHLPCCLYEQSSIGGRLSHCVRCGARVSGTKSNADNLILGLLNTFNFSFGGNLRSFLCLFLRNENITTSEFMSISFGVCCQFGTYSRRMCLLRYKLFPEKLIIIPRNL